MLEMLYPIQLLQEDTATIFHLNLLWVEVISLMFLISSLSMMEAQQAHQSISLCTSIHASIVLQLKRYADAVVVDLHHFITYNFVLKIIYDDQVYFIPPMKVLASGT